MRTPSVSVDGAPWSWNDYHDGGVMALILFERQYEIADDDWAPPGVLARWDSLDRALQAHQQGPARGRGGCLLPFRVVRREITETVVFQAVGTDPPPTDTTGDPESTTLGPENSATFRDSED
jgi:hypothetical protein